MNDNNHIEEFIFIGTFPVKDYELITGMCKNINIDFKIGNIQGDLFSFLIKEVNCINFWKAFTKINPCCLGD